ncbi:MAG: ATP-binding cassette domain-containing protein [Planctomycetota bacterium]|nr:ATP-binding cassette domain-containing protein [Planctomycetota bacterium]MDA1180098.1 ATP-binding cassette domain-containing protein [Planctomycetota bacterium]
MSESGLAKLLTPVRVQGLGVQLGGVQALEGVTHEFTPHVCTALVGPSGSGKSTLLRSIIGLVTPATGEVWLGQERMRPALLTELRRHVGYVIQDGGLFPHLSAWQNVSLMARHLRWPNARIDERIQGLSKLTGLELDALRRFPRELSGGQRQRVSIMRALFLDPPILLLDEPLGSLDPIIRASLQDELKTIMAELGKTTILVTHDLAEAAFLSNEIVLMQAGKLVQVGSFQSLCDTPATPFVTQFIRAYRGLDMPARTSG